MTSVGGGIFLRVTWTVAAPSCAGVAPSVATTLMALSPYARATAEIDQRCVAASYSAGRPLTVTRTTPVALSPSSTGVPATSMAASYVSKPGSGEVMWTVGASRSGVRRVTVSVASALFAAGAASVATTGMVFAPSLSATFAALQMCVVASYVAATPLTVTVRTPAALTPSSVAVPVRLTVSSGTVGLSAGDARGRGGGGACGG